MAIEKTLGLVLRRFPIRETSLVAVFFSPQIGKFSGILKGIRKDPKKFASSVDLFTLNEVVFYPSRSSNLHLVSKCDFIENCLSADNYEDYRLAGSLMRLVDIVTPERQENKGLFDMLISCLGLIGKEERNSLVRVFEIKLLDIVGFRPHLDGCVACLRRDIEKAWFSHKQGGLLCERCRDRDSTAIELSKGMISSVKAIEKMPLSKAMKVKFSAKDSNILHQLLKDFLHYHVSPRVRRTK